MGKLANPLFKSHFPQDWLANVLSFMEKAQGIRGHNSLLDREAAAFLPHVYNAAGERVICPDPTLKAPSGP